MRALGTGQSILTTAYVTNTQPKEQVVYNGSSI